MLNIPSQAEGLVLFLPTLALLHPKLSKIKRREGMKVTPGQLPRQKLKGWVHGLEGEALGLYLSAMHTK